MTSSHDLIFANLNDAQREAVQRVDGPVLILAGAGSGKTRTLTHRIAYLIQQGVPAWQILAVTFTNKAANEMRERITNLLKLAGKGSETQMTSHGVPSTHKPFPIREFPSPDLPVMGTFHSVCVRILRRDIEAIGRSKNFVIYDTSDQEALMKEVLKDVGIDVQEMKAKTALAHIGRFKSEALSVKEVAEQATTEFIARMVKIYGQYQAKLRNNGALDFDDLILETVRLFHEAPDVLHRYQHTWRYLNVDEYQDTNHAQYLLISQLARAHRNLCVIGDPDQSIYAFRGADIRNILEFQAEYKDAFAIKLERNYRSTQQILDCADAVIAVNPRRPQKKMYTHRVDGEKIILHEVRDEREEAREVIQNVINAMAQGMKLNEQVVLYRTNAQSRQFEEACMRAALPYRIVGGVKFYARREVKDLLAYLYVIHNPEDSLSLLRIINVPSRKIGKTTLEHINVLCQERNCSLWDALQLICKQHHGNGSSEESAIEKQQDVSEFPHDVTLSEAKHPMDAERSRRASQLLSEQKEHDRMNDVPAISEPVKNRIASFVDLIESYRKKRTQLTVSQLAKDLLAEIEMEKWVKDDTSEGEARWANIGELLSVMHKYDQLQPEESFTSFLEEVALVSEVDKLHEVRDDALTLMTLHLCKGLEFRHVIITGCEEGILPHANALFDREQQEEERRLLYVGMTRAKDTLRLFAARSRMLWGEMQANPVSRFLDDLPFDLVEKKSDDIMSSVLWKVSQGASLSSPPAAMSRFSKGVGKSRPTAGTNRSPQLRAEHNRKPSRGIQPYREHTEIDLEFNQDHDFAEQDLSEDAQALAPGSRISHPAFGDGTVTARRGDLIEVTFDSGKKKTLALSIAPLKVLT